MFDNLTAQMTERLAKALRPWSTGQQETSMLQFGDQLVGASTENVLPRIEGVEFDQVQFEADLASTDSGKGASLVGFLQSGTGAQPDNLGRKVGEIASVTDWMTPAERADAKLAVPLLDHTAAIQAAVTAQQGKALFFPDGMYANTATPTGIDGVHCTGSPRVQFTGMAIPLFMGVFTGNVESAIVGGVIRYYASGANGAGWYFLKDQGANHDPVLLGPVITTGASSVILEMRVADFGLDPDEWTPAGFVCGPDETLAASGCIFGASVGSDTIQIKGSYAGIRPAYINYNGTNWTGTNAPYTYEWIGTPKLLRVTRTTPRQGYSGGSSGIPMLTVRRGSADPLIHVALDTTSTTSFDVRFYDAAGAQIVTESTSLKFYVHDPVALPEGFDFNIPTESTAANIWMVGVFGRKATTY